MVNSDFALIWEFPSKRYFRETVPFESRERIFGFLVKGFSGKSLRKLSGY